MGSPPAVRRLPAARCFHSAAPAEVELLLAPQAVSGAPAAGCVPPEGAAGGPGRSSASLSTSMSSSTLFLKFCGGAFWIGMPDTYCRYNPNPNLTTHCAQADSNVCIHGIVLGPVSASSTLFLEFCDGAGSLK